MTIMQSGIASVAFAFVVQRERGVLRRVMATPISRRSFLAAHVLQRLVTLIVQVLILLGVAVLMFKVSVVGSMAALLLVAVLGAAVFLCLGFAVSGIVATENAVPPVTQIVTLPQMFLSGVFFSKDAAPAFLRPVSEVLPLTFLNDALRSVSAQGATLPQIGPQLLGLVVWIAVSFFLAFRFFRLEV
jgi:ABC-2 type transport system permease protein